MLFRMVELRSSARGGAGRDGNAESESREVWTAESGPWWRVGNPDRRRTVAASKSRTGSRPGPFTGRGGPPLIPGHRRELGRHRLVSRIAELRRLPHLLPVRMSRNHDRGWRQANYNHMIVKSYRGRRFSPRTWCPVGARQDGDFHYSHTTVKLWNRLHRRCSQRHSRWGTIHHDNRI